jgi:hypothetical protein
MLYVERVVAEELHEKNMSPQVGVLNSVECGNPIIPFPIGVYCWAYHITRIHFRSFWVKFLQIETMTACLPEHRPKVLRLNLLARICANNLVIPRNVPSLLLLKV